MNRYLLLLCLGLFCCTQAFGAIVRVGRNRTLGSPSNAAAVAHDGDTILIDSDQYSNCATWPQSNLTIKAAGNGVVHVRDAVCGGKAIWVIQGNNVTIENIEFSDVTSATDKNAAGIRAEGTNLTVRHCYFHDMDEGILTGANPLSTITIEYCEFVHNGYGDGYSHNMYIGNIQQFILRGCNVHGAYNGHNVKSRAMNNFISYNRIMDENDSTSRDIDLPNGGAAFIVGNIIEKGKAAANSNIIGYGEEGVSNPSQTLMLVNNTFENDRSNGGTYIALPTGTHIDSLILYNNLIVGPGFLVTGLPATFTDSAKNMRYATATAAGLVDGPNYNYHLTGSSPAIDAATTTGVPFGTLYLPDKEYAYPNPPRPRPVQGPLDIGAFEYVSNSAVEPQRSLPPSSVLLDIYPNPTSSFATVSYIALAGAASLEIFNACGVRIEHSTTITFSGEWNQVQINGASLPAGTYFARLISGSGVVVRPFVVLR